MHEVIHVIEKEIPGDFYRGLSAIDHFTSEGYLTAAAFKFDSYCAERGDQYCELSINWNDDEGALERLLTQRKPSTDIKQFRFGYTKMSVSMLRMLFRTYIDDGKFSYERRPILADPEADIEDNPYHGNLLMDNQIGNSIRKNIQHSLATLGTSGAVINKEGK